MRMLKRLNTKCIEHLCRHLNCTEAELEGFCHDPEAWYWRGKKTIKGKVRPISRPVGRFYAVSNRLQRLLSRIALPPYLHGGIKGCSPKTNASIHIGKAAILKFDLQDFFPRIRPGQVYRMFRDRLGCSPKIAKILTRIVTLDGGIPQGSPTSTTVANLVIVPLATRLNRLATCHGSDYSQFVDDGAMSGPAYLEKLRPLVEEIVRQEGFRASPKEKKRKTLYWYQEQVVTGVKVNRKIDAPQEKVDEASAFLDAIQVQLAFGSKVSDREIRSVAGKVQHIRTLNPNKGLRLQKRLDTLLN